jgi:peptidoglycan/xylan/chitin deacetylase (PgdA/CDA1 family)
MPAPAEFTWPGGHRLALSIVVNVEEGAEQNIRDGDKGPEPVDELSAVPKRPMRMHGNESNYQYGIKAGAPRILKLLDELAARIAARGDEVCCHGWRWAHQFWMDEDKERDFIRKGWESIERTTGKRPGGWLSRYLHTEATRRLLVEEGFGYHMDDYSDDFPFWDVVETAQGRKPIVILPYALDSNDMKFWLAPALTARDWLAYATDTFDQMHAEAMDGETKMMSLGLHLRIIGRPGRIGAFRGFLEHVRDKPGVWVTSRGKIAAAFADAVPPPA